MTLPSELLEKGIETLGIQIQVEPLMAYLSLLQKWNKAVNLTAITDLEEMVVKHLLDSLSIAPFIQGERILDIGTGGGLPGIPLAITFPDKTFFLCDSVGKKCVFLQEVSRQLTLSNVHVVHSRIETYKPDETFDMIVSRALAASPKMITQSTHLLNEEGQWLFMKGELDKQELAGIPYDYVAHSLDVPYLDAARHAILVGQNKNK